MGVQQFKSSGVREFGRWGLQQFVSSGVQEMGSSGVQLQGSNQSRLLRSKSTSRESRFVAAAERLVYTRMYKKYTTIFYSSDVLADAS